MVGFIIILILIACVSKAGAGAIKGMLLLIFGSLFLLASCGMV